MAPFVNRTAASTNTAVARHSRSPRRLGAGALAPSGVTSGQPRSTSQLVIGSCRPSRVRPPARVTPAVAHAERVNATFQSYSSHLSRGQRRRCSGRSSRSVVPPRRACAWPGTGPLATGGTHPDEVAHVSSVRDPFRQERACERDERIDEQAARGPSRLSLRVAAAERYGGSRERDNSVESCPRGPVTGRMGAAQPGASTCGSLRERGTCRGYGHRWRSCWPERHRLR